VAVWTATADDAVPTGGSVTCPSCGGETVAFAVPAALRAHAPTSSECATICASCLRVHAADRRPPSDSAFGRIHAAFPTGEAGAALALALGLLDSLALRRADIDDCAAAAEEAGADVLLTLDRLADADGVDPHFDVDRRRHQLAELLS
jgi:hypothetical protein